MSEEPKEERRKHRTRAGSIRSFAAFGNPPAQQSTESPPEQHQDPETSADQEYADVPISAERSGSSVPEGENVQTSQHGNVFDTPHLHASTSPSDVEAFYTQDVETSKNPAESFSLDKERLDAETLRDKDTKTSGRGDVLERPRADVQTLKPSDVSTLTRSYPETSFTERREDVQTSQGTNQQLQERPDVQTQRRQRDPEREAGRQTVYLDPELRKWVKHRAIDEEMPISDLILKAIQQYRASIEGR